MTASLADIGPTLPPELHPVAEAGAALPTRTWAVVVVADDGPPTLIGAGDISGIPAARLAATLAATYGHVYLVHRCPDTVTVHTRDLAHRGNTLGTITVAAGTPRNEWDRITGHTFGDPRRDAEHARLVHDAVRRAHHLPADMPAHRVVLHAIEHPLPQLDYVLAYVQLLGDPAALHRHAETEHRAQLTHITARTEKPAA